jgi:hypothetical protein
MKSRIRVAIAALAMLIVGFIGGYFVACKISAVECKRSLEALNLAETASRTAMYASLLKSYRECDRDLPSTLEMVLDHSVIRLAAQYSPNLDWFGSATKSMNFAREYRSAFPYTSTSQRTSEQVKAALAIKQISLQNR